MTEKQKKQKKQIDDLWVNSNTEWIHIQYPWGDTTIKINGIPVVDIKKKLFPNKEIPTLEFDARDCKLKTDYED